ncbi:MAG: methionine gamma-lyase family protein [Candidatus Borkfalkiaceae bacterium]|nr:methionine gamma-lyase family protein [Clostridia bacterium]MDY6222620.1 methionine gamma-lyase family protein [Christensenellaceae bacterium]
MQANNQKKKNYTAEELIKESEGELKEAFALADEISEENQAKVIDAFTKNNVALRHFNPSSGYGLGDEGRHVLSQVYADSMGAEAGIVSPALLSGTHTLAVALFGILRPGDRALSVTGLPYDTLQSVIFGENNGSLKELGVKFDLLPLTNSGAVDFSALDTALKNAESDLKMIYIQRSRGYELRNALTVEEIGEICSFVRARGFKGCIFVDNCYGEFVQKQEPCDVGADISAGSLIKNPGGGLAPTGGYIVGKKKYMEKVANRLTAPSLGDEIGSYAYGYRLFFQGVFLAPHVVNQAVKGSLLIGKCMEKLGYENFPKFGRTISDITRAIRFDTAEQLCDFIRSVQEASPVDSFAVCEPCDMPGYEAKVIMAAGCFVEGASIELSADAPVREPYTAYFQGGLTYEHCKYALKKILKKLI